MSTRRFKKPKHHLKTNVHPLIRSLLMALCACNHAYKDHLFGKRFVKENDRGCALCPCLVYEEDNLEWMIKNDAEKTKQ